MSDSEKRRNEPPSGKTTPKEGGSTDQDAARRLVQNAEPFLGLESSAEAPTVADTAASAEPFRFAELSHQVRVASGISSSGDVELQVQLGQTQLNVDELTALESGSLLTLNELASEPVEILSNGQVIARAEVVMLGDEPAVRIVEVL